VAPQGPPACFNRLASGTDAAVVVLIKSGTVLGPGCLPLLAEALTRPGAEAGRAIDQPLLERAGSLRRRVPLTRFHE
jgi:hypothetical protein